MAFTCCSFIGCNACYLEMESHCPVCGAPNLGLVQKTTNNNDDADHPPAAAAKMKLQEKTPSIESIVCGLKDKELKESMSSLEERVKKIEQNQTSFTGLIRTTLLNTELILSRVKEFEQNAITGNTTFEQRLLMIICVGIVISMMVTALSFCLCGE